MARFPSDKKHFHFQTEFPKASTKNTRSVLKMSYFMLRTETQVHHCDPPGRPLRCPYLIVLMTPLLQPLKPANRPPCPVWSDTCPASSTSCLNTHTCTRSAPLLPTSCRRGICCRQNASWCTQKHTWLLEAHHTFAHRNNSQSCTHRRTPLKCTSSQTFRHFLAPELWAHLAF